MAKQPMSYVHLSTLNRLISYYPKLEDFLLKKTRPNASGKAEINEDNPTQTMITNHTIDQAMQGPYHPLVKVLLSAYMTHAKASFALTLHDDTQFEDHLLPNHPLKLNVKQTRALTEETIDSVKKTLNGYLKDFSTTWAQALEQWQQLILQQLQTSKLICNELEIQNFLCVESNSELIELIHTLNLTSELTLQTPIVFSDFLSIKLYIAIRSCQSRQHLSHTPKDIQRLLKDFKTHLAHIKKEQRKLHLTQNKQALEAVHPIDLRSHAT